MGILVVIIVGTLVVKYLKSDRGTIPQELLTGTNSIERLGKTHTVAKGENLWQISVKYYGDGFKWVDIATENKLSNASVIEVGQELTIPDLEAENIEATANIENAEKVTPAPEVANAITTATYEVVKGDSLWKIAVRAYGDGYKWVEIAKENKIVNPNIIFTGNVLVLPR